MRRAYLKSFLRSACLMLAGGAILAGCSNDDSSDAAANAKIDMASGIEFKLDFADYGEDTEVTGTRSAAAVQPIATETVELGNDLFAEVTVQRDTEAVPAQSKATTRSMNNGTYTMVAYQNGVMKGEVTGTVAGGTFTATSSNPAIQLTPGTYDFVCYNDKVTRSGDQLTVERADAGEALIGRVTNVAVKGEKQQVTFTMKHAGARMRIKLTGYMAMHNAIKATVSSDDAAPATATYDMLTGTYSYTNGPLATDEYEFPLNEKDILQASEFTSVSNSYQYFMAGTDGSKLKLSFTGGNYYFKELAGKTIELNPEPALQMEQNGSYLVNVKLKYDFYYLYSDGTVGRLSANADKTPVGIVVSRSKRLACALKKEELRFWCSGSENYKQSNYRLVTTLAESLTDMDGEKYTWEPSGSLDGVTVKANEKERFPAFYGAAHFDPGVELTGGLENKRWFAPSIGQLMYLITGLGGGSYDEAASHPNYSGAYPNNWDVAFHGELLNAGFLQVGYQSTYYSNVGSGTSSTETSRESYASISWYPEKFSISSYGKSGNPNFYPFINY